MTNRAALIVTLGLIVLSVVLTLAAYPQLPPRVASHWNADNVADGTMPRFWGAFLTPLISLAMLGLLFLIPAIDPLRVNIQTFRPSFNLFVVLVIAFLGYLHVLTLLWNTGFTGFHMSTALLPALGILFIAVGRMLRFAKRNFTIGIRTPWTLSSDSVWERTHQLGAKLFYVCGIIAVLGAFVPGPAAYLLVMGPLLVSTLVLVVYSFFAWRGEQTNRG